MFVVLAVIFLVCYHVLRKRSSSPPPKLAEREQTPGDMPVAQITDTPIAELDTERGMVEIQEFPK